MFDVLTTAAVADELTARIMDGRVQQVGMTERLGIGLEVYANGRRVYLVGSAEADDPRVLLHEREPSFDRQLVTPLVLLLRKYVRGGAVVGIEQPPLERILRVSIAKRLMPHNGPDERTTEPDAPLEEPDDAPDGMEGATFTHLVFEVMGRHSNILLLDDDGRVMEAVKRVTPAMSRLRPIAPRVRYTEPPVGERGDPRRLSTAEAGILLGGERPDAPVATVLPKRLRGFSPQMAREIAWRALGRAEATVGEARADGGAVVARETRRLLEPLLTSDWSPTVYFDPEGEPVAYAAVPLDHLAARYRAETFASISAAALRAAGADEVETPGKHAQRKTRLQAEIREGKRRLAARLASLQTQAERVAEGGAVSPLGEAIYANLWAIRPGQAALEIEGESIPLDPGLKPSDAAQGYFEQYRKAQSAGAHLPPLIAAGEAEIAFLDQLDLLAGQADHFAELEDVSLEWEGYRRTHEGGRGAGKRRPRSTPPRRTRSVTQVNGNAIYLGRSSAENDRITFEIAGPNDTWLHARGIPGSHVIVRWANAEGAEDAVTLETAAGLAAYYSGGREGAGVEVDVTRRRFVRKIKGAGPGMVTYRNERTVSARPRPLEQER